MVTEFARLVTKAENRWGNGASKKTRLPTKAFKTKWEANALIGVVQNGISKHRFHILRG
jgi:hypothetical protein